MSNDDEDRRAWRLEDVVRRLGRVQRPRIEPRDARDEPAIRAASRLAGARDSYPRMDPAFRRSLAAQLTRPRATGPSRRWALAAAAGIVAGAAIGVAGGQALEDHPQSSTTSRRGRLAPEALGATWVDTGVTVRQLTDGVPLQVVAGGLPIFLVREGQNVRAFSSICTHKPCQLVWDDALSRIVCPWGRYQTFSPLSGASLANAVPPLPPADVRVEGERIEVYGIT